MKNTRIKSFVIAASSIAMSAGFAGAATLTLVDTIFTSGTDLTPYTQNEYIMYGDASWTINLGVTVAMGTSSAGGIFVDGHSFDIKGGGTLVGTVSDSRGFRMTNNSSNSHGVVNITGNTTVQFTSTNARVYAKDFNPSTNVSGTINIEAGSSLSAAGTYNSGTGEFTSNNTFEVLPVDIAALGAGVVQSSYDGTYTTLTVAVVPESSSAVLLGLGGLAALILRRRK